MVVAIDIIGNDDADSSDLLFPKMGILACGRMVFPPWAVQVYARKAWWLRLPRVRALIPLPLSAIYSVPVKRLSRVSWSGLISRFSAARHAWKATHQRNTWIRRSPFTPGPTRTVR